MRSLGNQIVAEFYHCDCGRLDDVEFIEQAMVDAAQIAGATIVSRAFHHFSPHGVSGAVIIAESHLAVHTWPEYGYAAVDLFTCGDDILAVAAFEHLREMFTAGQVSTMEIHRGQVDMMRPVSNDQQHAQLSLVK
jgi:S-adenosylmethionine decarboxylase